MRDQSPQPTAPAGSTAPERRRKTLGNLAIDDFTRSIGIRHDALSGCTVTFWDVGRPSMSVPRKGYAGGLRFVPGGLQTWFPDYLSTLPRVGPKARHYRPRITPRCPETRRPTMPSVPQAADILASSGRRHLSGISRPTRSPGAPTPLRSSRYSRRNTGERRGVLEIDRAVALDPPRRTRPFGAVARRRRRPLPDRIWRTQLDFSAGDLDRGNRMLVCRSRRQARAGAGRRQRQQRAPCPRRATIEIVAARSLDRRTQPHPSGRLARRGDRGMRALPLVQRLHADRHRSSGAGQRCLRF